MKIHSIFKNNFEEKWLWHSFYYLLLTPLSCQSICFGRLCSHHPHNIYISHNPHFYLCPGTFSAWQISYYLPNGMDNDGQIGLDKWFLLTSAAIYVGVIILKDQQWLVSGEYNEQYNWRYMHNVCVLLCFVVVRYRMILFISNRIASLALTLK